MADNKKVKKGLLNESADDNMSILPEDTSVGVRVAVLFGMLLIAFSVVIIAIKIRFVIKENIEKKAISYVSSAEYYGEMLDCMNRLDEYVSFDKELCENVESDSKYVIKNYKRLTLNSRQVAGIILINKNLESGKDDKLKSLLKEYYDEDSKLIHSYKLSINFEESDEEIVSNTIHIAHMLRYCDDYLEEIDIYNGLANYFNDHKEISQIEEDLNELTDIFFLMYDKNKQDMLSYDILKDVLVDDIISVKALIDNETIEGTLSNVILAKRVSIFRQVFYNDSSYVDAAEEVFADIETRAGFEISSFKVHLLYELNDALSYVRDSEDNKFLVQNISEILEQYYNSYIVKSK